MKRLVLFFDGTWNDPEDNTNVWKMKTMLAEQSPDGIRQLDYYDPGVGTQQFQKLRGGIGGYGLKKNVQEAYEWLIQNYVDGDEIYLFGFSRGAFTARSVAGLISKCGLLTPGSPLAPVQVFERYCQKKEPLYRLKFWAEFHPEKLPKGREDEWLLKYSRKIQIKFIGVWDTVSSVGIPMGKIRIKGFSRKALDYHHTRLSVCFEHCYQALALDEHRRFYEPILWTHFIPDNEPDKKPPTPNVEQRWFKGAHANVGGGYQNDLLSLIPLHWMQQKAISVGLSFHTVIQLNGKEQLDPVRDSYKEFLKGFFRLIPHMRIDRQVKSKPKNVMTKEGQKGVVVTVNEQIHGT